MSICLSQMLYVCVGLVVLAYKLSEVKSADCLSKFTVPLVLRLRLVITVTPYACEFVTLEVEG